MQYFVYILYSEKLDKYYIGSTGNLEDRLKKHNRSRSGFTSLGKPWIMVYNEVFCNKADSLKREKQLKNWKNRDRIEFLIQKSSVGSGHPDWQVGRVAGSSPAVPTLQIKQLQGLNQVAAF
jgi:putative endonuclease